MKMGHEYSKFRKYTYITFANMFIYINLLKSELVHFCVNIFYRSIAHINYIDCTMIIARANCLTVSSFPGHFIDRTVSLTEQ